MYITNAHYLIIDLEATCNNDGLFPREEMEIIEIGAIILDAKQFEIAAEFQTFVQPVRHPILTPFCTELTTIQQEQVESAPSFAEAMANMSNWLSAFDDALFCSWGNYDRTQFQQDCQFHEVDYPFGDGHMNIKTEFSKALNQRKSFGIGGALKKLRLAFEGTPHRGIDDVRNIARIVQHICAGG